MKAVIAAQITTRGIGRANRSPLRIHETGLSRMQIVDGAYLGKRGEVVWAVPATGPLHRLNDLATRPELWDDDGRETPSPQVVERVRQILVALEPAVPAEYIRLYRSDADGISVEVSRDGAARIVDVEPDTMLGFDLEKPARDSRMYQVASTATAAMFLAGPKRASTR